MAKQQPLVNQEHPKYWTLRFVVAAALDILNIEMTDPHATRGWSDESRAIMQTDAQTILDLLHEEAQDV